MAKISKSEFLDNIQNIINEGMNKTVTAKDNTKKFSVRRHVISLIESGQQNPKLMSYLNQYHKILNNNNVKEFMLYEQFGQGLAQFAPGNKEVKKVINTMNETLANYGGELQTYMLIEQIQDPMAQETVLSAYNNYLAEENDEARNLLVDAIDAVDMTGDPVAPQLLVIIADDAQARIPQIQYGISNDTTFEDVQQKIRDEKERKRLEDIKNRVDAYARQVFDEAEAETKAQREAELNACTFDNIVNNNGLDLRESIKNIVSSDANSNSKLMETLEQYAGALNQGLFEERLYESFLQNLSKYNYLLPVEKEINRINEVAKQHSASIIVTKILEEMQTTPSYYIIPLIEEDACRYVKNPSDTNRVQLRQALCSFAADPYCHAMLEAIERDGVIAANTLSEKALSIKDQIKMIRENANIEAIYSPVQYIRENECVFNANGQFYVKKGNTLAKLNNEYLNQLSENFVALCQLVNDPRVTINEDSITLVGTDKIANIYEGYVDINGCRETTDTLRDLNEMSMKYDFDTNFFIMASCLHEHFNDIAKVEFGKHIALNENAGINVDMFRLGNNIFINTVNENVDKSTFYHNVNPLQCRNIINKHMGINVASLFEDLMPSQDKIIMKLNETKNEYEESLAKYEATLDKLKKAKEECISEDNEKKLDDAIETAENKINELKKEYKNWQKEVEKQTTGNDKSDKSEKDAKDFEDDPNTEVEPSNEPIDADEVENVKDEMTEPIGNVEDEEDPTITDDEFDSYLEGGDSIPASVVNDEESEEIEDNEESVEDEEPAEEPIEDEEPIENEEPAEDPFAEVNVEDEEPVEGEEADYPDYDEVDIENDDEAENSEEYAQTDDVIFDEDDNIAVPDGYKITNIAFDKNIKTGEIFNTGTVSIICPMVDETGRLYVQSNDYQFYIDKESNLPVVDASNIPVALYNAVISTIKADPEYNNVCENGIENNDSCDDTNTDIMYDADEVEQISDDLNKSDDDFFNYEDEDGELKITSKDDEADEDNNEIVIPTYKSEDGETDIELPAPEVDGTAIPEELPSENDNTEDIKDFDDELDQMLNVDDQDENLENEEKTEEPEENEKSDTDEEDVDFNVEDIPVEESKKNIFESRKALLKINSEFKKNGKRFFLNEGTIKPSKKEEARINEAQANIDSIDETNEAPNVAYEPYEDYNVQMDMNSLEVMHDEAEKTSSASSQMGYNLKVTPIEDFYGLCTYFTIEDLSSVADIDSYTCYKIGNEIYYRPSEEFYSILRDLEDEVPGQTIEALKYDYTSDSLKDYIDDSDTNGCIDLIITLCSCLGINLTLAESIKVKRPSLSSKGDKEKSKQYDDILHGDKEKRDFEENVEKDTQKSGIDNPLAPSNPPAEESQNIIVKDAENISESSSINEKKNLEELEIIYEPEDWIIIKETGKKAQVNTVNNDGDGKFVFLTAVGPDGSYTIEDLSEIEPDPMYLINYPGRVVNSQNLYVAEIPGADIDPETRLPKPLPKEPIIPKEEKGKKKEESVLDKLTVPVCVMVEGYKLNDVPFKAIVEDIKDSKKMIRVINEAGEIDEYDVEQNLEFQDMPYAVVVDSEGKPVRSIKIDPLSYINAEDDELVDCTCADKPTKFPKKVINILS